jgi:uncharacterized phage-associated protein
MTAITTISAMDVANYFIAKAYTHNQAADITNIKLQKLLYYAQSLHLALYDAPLFPEEIQAWRCGPVCPNVYHFYQEGTDKTQPLPKLDADRNLELPRSALEVLTETWDFLSKYGSHSLIFTNDTNANDIANHEFPWQNARRGLPADADSQLPISLQDMKKLGSQKLDQIERSHPDYAQLISAIIASPPTKPAMNKEEFGAWLDSVSD